VAIKLRRQYSEGFKERGDVGTFIELNVREKKTALSQWSGTITEKQKLGKAGKSIGSTFLCGGGGGGSQGRGGKELILNLGKNLCLEKGRTTHRLVRGK